MTRRKTYVLTNLLLSLTLFLGYSDDLRSQSEEEIILPNPIEILGDSLYVQNDTTIDSKDSQSRITDLSLETQELLGEYRLVLQQIDRLIAYNDYVERLIKDQENQIIEINRQLEEFALIERGIVPLMLESIETLDRFIDLDIPFLLEERKDRVARLRVIMDESDMNQAKGLHKSMGRFTTKIHRSCQRRIKDCKEANYT